jgi:CRISPR-associated exonuclease Cas4
MAHKLEPDQENELLLKGKNIHEEHFKRNKKELILENSRIDMLHEKNGSLVVSEIKISSKYLEPAILQLKYYMMEFFLKGVKVKGELRIPQERKVIDVTFDQNDLVEMEKVVLEISRIVTKGMPPKLVRINFCHSCAYSEFCWS